VTNFIPFAVSTDDEANDSNLRTNPFQKERNDGRTPKQGSITRFMVKHIEAQEKSETPVHINMLTTLSLCEHL